MDFWRFLESGFVLVFMIVFFGSGGGVGWEVLGIFWLVFLLKVMVLFKVFLGCRGCLGGIMVVLDCFVLF